MRTPRTRVVSLIRDRHLDAAHARVSAGHPSSISRVRQRCCLVIESGTDVRLVEGIAAQFDVKVLARRIVGGREINHSPVPPVELSVGPSGRLGFAWYTFRHVCRDRATFVIVQGYGLAALATNIACRLTGGKCCMLVCSPVEAYYQCKKQHPTGGHAFSATALVAMRILARINGVVGQQYVVLSRYLADVVRSHGTRRSIAVIPVYGVDTNRFSPPLQEKAVLRERMGLPASGAIVLFSSRIAPEKDSETLLAAMKQLIEEGRDLWILHRSGGYRRFQSHADHLGIGHRVIATDAVHPYLELPRDIQVSDLCVQASREEGLGFSPLEALACGVPVVATAVGGLVETVIDGETGWTYPVGDVAALAKCVTMALDQPEEAERRARNGRVRVIAAYESRDVFSRLAETIAKGEYTAADLVVAP